MPALATITNKGQLTIPKEIRDLVGLKLNEKVLVMAKKDQIILKPAGRDFLSLYGSVKHSGPPLDFKAVRRKMIRDLAKRAVIRGRLVASQK